MKKLLLKFADSVLTREELKTVRGASKCGYCIGPNGPLACFRTTSLGCACIAHTFCGIN